MDARGGFRRASKHTSPEAGVRSELTQKRVLQSSTCEGREVQEGQRPTESLYAMVRTSAVPLQETEVTAGFQPTGLSKGKPVPVCPMSLSYGCLCPHTSVGCHRGSKGHRRVPFCVCLLPPTLASFPPGGTRRGDAEEELDRWGQPSCYQWPRPAGSRAVAAEGRGPQVGSRSGEAQILPAGQRSES